MHDLCAKEPTLPTPTTVYKWLHKNVEFRDQYALAREYQADTFVDEIISIADNNTLDVSVNKKTGKVTVHGETVNRSRLKSDNRKWAAARHNAKKYGDRLQMDVTLNYNDMNNEELLTAIKAISAELGVTLPKDLGIVNDDE